MRTIPEQLDRYLRLVKISDGTLTGRIHERTFFPRHFVPGRRGSAMARPAVIRDT
ncbi:MAG: hypothetical protein JO271_10265 [Verrucomicrobia bacterium]|nr:hypothetical protein [Verrucomicrobiota bacterium]